MACKRCHGTGRDDSHVTGEIECPECEGCGVTDDVQTVNVHDELHRILSGSRMPPDEKLLEMAVRSARAKGMKHPRWVAVMDAFCLGSTMAKELCVRFGLEPDEIVSR